MEEYFLNWAKKLIGSAMEIEKESHGDEGLVYKITTEKGNYFLKINHNSISADEFYRLEWFQRTISVPEIVGFTVKDDSKALLLTALPGKNLAVLSKEWEVEKVIDHLVEVLHKFHAIDASNWPFDVYDPSKILVHGDACLPNFIFNGDKFSGYIDLGDAKLAIPEVDLAAAIWSLQYNLGVGHGVRFLNKYGYKNATEDTAEKLRLKYEDYQRAHGFL